MNNKIITYSQIGYNHPSQANWSYGIFKVDLIDVTREYCMSYVVKETFGGDDRFVSRWKNCGVPIIQTKCVWPAQKFTGIKKIDNIESEEFNMKVSDFLNQKQS